MKVLVVGSGGREHALAWSIRRSPLCERLWCAPGNAGMEAVADCVPIKSDDLHSVVAFARSERPDLVVVGPEAPLVAGLADRLREEDFPTFGPGEQAAAIEGSKAFAKRLMVQAGVPTAGYWEFSEIEAALGYLDELQARGTGSVVVKASGLAAGKGAVVCPSIEGARQAAHRMLVEAEFGDSGSVVIIEECLSGEELSLFAVTDGDGVCYLPPAQDHKRLLDEDLGPNTGGMGAYAPAPLATAALTQEADERVFQPVLKALREAGTPYSGCLFGGLMLTPEGPRVIEFNCRLGDPEAQALLTLLHSDLLELLFAAATGGISSHTPVWDPGYAVCVVLASEGYPIAYETGVSIDGLEEAARMEGVTIFHAGTKKAQGGVVTAGGRVLNVVGRGPTLAGAAARAYQAVERIDFKGKIFRRDIARRAVERERKSERSG